MNKTKKIIATIMLLIMLGITIVSTNTYAATKTVGDINGDGKINVTDIVKVAAYLKGYKKLNDEEIKAADVDGNGELNQDDITLMSLRIKNKKLFPSETRKGDINLDGKVNVTDLVVMAAHIKSKRTFKYEFYKNQADLNGDGKVNISDFIKLRKML